MAVLKDKASAKIPRIKYAYGMYADSSPHSGHLHYSNLMRMGKMHVLVSYNPSFHRRVLQLGSFHTVSKILVARRRCSRIKKLSSLQPFYRFHSVPICTRSCATAHLGGHVPCYFARGLCPNMPRVPLGCVGRNRPFIISGMTKGRIRMVPFHIVRKGLPVVNFHVKDVT